MRNQLAALALTLGFATFAASQAPGEFDKFRDLVFKGVNEMRAKKDLAPLKRNTKLDAAAQKHAENMAQQDKFGDDDKNGAIMDGKGLLERLQAEEFPIKNVTEHLGIIPLTNQGGKVKGELAVGLMVKRWQQTAALYNNIVSEKYTETGIGVAQSKSGKWYNCQIFSAGE
jgi:uncharacterized protein YkwD